MLFNHKKSAAELGQLDPLVMRFAYFPIQLSRTLTITANGSLMNLPRTSPKHSVYCHQPLGDIRRRRLHVQRPSGANDPLAEPIHFVMEERRPSGYALLSEAYLNFSMSYNAQHQPHAVGVFAFVLFKHKSKHRGGMSAGCNC